MIQLLNADFELVPTFVAAQTADNWIDGTAAGSASNSTYGWWASPRAAAITVQFDTSKSRSGAASLKLSTTNTTGRARAFNVKASAGSITASSANKPFLIPALPSTKYTLTGWAQTNNVAAAGCFIEIAELSSAFVVGVSTGSNTLAGTNATWTLLTATVTTAATCNWLAIDVQNATAGNISDAWFDDLVLVGPDGRFLNLL
jgi:hypothetical protein